MNETIEKLIEFIENASPVVWSILIKQVYAEAFAALVWIVLLVILLGVTYKFVSKVRKQDEHYDEWHEEKIALGYLMFGISAVIAFALLAAMIMRLVNPEFYAINYILTLIGGQ